MNDSPADNSFVARSGLNRTIKYRAIISASFYGCLVLAGLSLVTALVYLGVQIATRGLLNPLVLFTLLLLVPSLSFALAWLRFRPFAFTVIKIRPEGFTKERPGDQSTVLFAQIKAVRLWHLPYLGGRFRLTEENGGVHEFTASLERSEYILEALQAARPDLLSEQKFLRYRRTAVTSDHSWARLHDRLNERRRELLLLFVALPIVGFAVAWPIIGSPSGARGSRLSEAAAILGALFLLNLTVGLTTYVVAESYQLFRGRRRLRESPNDLRRDPALELKLNRATVWAHLAIYSFALGAAIAALAPQ